LDKTLMIVIICSLFCISFVYRFQGIPPDQNFRGLFYCRPQSGFLSFIMLIIGSIISGMTVLGSSGLSYVAGWPSMWEPIFVTLSIAVLITIFGAKLYRVSRKFGYYTVQDYLSHRFESPKIIRAIAGIAGILISFIYLTGQFTAISIVLSWLLGIDHVYALLIGTVVVTLYVFLGGLYAVAYTTLVQALALLFGTILITPFVIKAAGGLTAINTQLAAINPQFIAAAYPQVHPPAAGNAFLTPYFIISSFSS
jgi:Na+/proline symporter